MLTKRGLFSLMLGSATGLLAACDKGPRSSQQTMQWGKVIHQESHLRINNDASFRVVVQKSESAGIKDLLKLAQQESQEEYWAFLPQKEQWVEIGLSGGRIEIQPQLDSIEAVVSADHELLEKLFREHLDLRLYHIHPLHLENVAMNLWEDREKSAGRTSNDEDRAWARTLISANNVLPSEFDLVSLLEFQRAIEETLRKLKIEEAIGVQHRIVSPWGITDYRVKRLLQDRIDIESLAKAEYSKMFQDFETTLSAFAKAGYASSSFDQRIEKDSWLKEISERMSHVEVEIVRE